MNTSFDLGLVVGYLNSENHDGLMGLVLDSVNKPDVDVALYKHGLHCDYEDVGTEYCIITGLNKVAVH